jgi:prolyl oligopeptidase
MSPQQPIAVPRGRRSVHYRSTIISLLITIITATASTNRVQALSLGRRVFSTPRRLFGGGAATLGLFSSSAHSSSSSGSFFVVANQQHRRPPTTSKIIMSSTMDNADDAAIAVDGAAEDEEEQEDPYLWLEEVESERALQFATDSNQACLTALGDPLSGTTYERVLAVLESNDRIPFVSNIGINPVTGDRIVLNLWKDAVNPKGLLRQTTFQSYQTESPTWTTLLDVDQLAAIDGISWVYKGSSDLPRSRDNGGNPFHAAAPTTKSIVERTLLKLSRGGSDAITIREFDYATASFVSDNEDNNSSSFDVSTEAKTSIMYKNRNIVWIGTDCGPGSLTESGYPRTVREWQRGTPLSDAPIIYEGEPSDVSVGMYIADERIWNGGIYVVRYRSLTFYTSKHWVRKISEEELFSASTTTTTTDDDFVEVAVQDDASIDFLGTQLIISLRSDWEVNGVVYQQGSHIMTDTDTFLAHGPTTKTQFTVLFQPTDRTAYEYHTCTKNYLILSTMDNVKSKLEFFKITNGGATLTPLGAGPAVAQIRSCNVAPIDPYAGSDECWFTTSDYVTPTTLCLADAGRVESTNNIDAFVVDVEQQPPVKALPHQYDATGLVVEQRIAISKDGTEIPYFIVLQKKEEDTNASSDGGGEKPTLLYGYGGFEVSLGPHYIATTGLAWLERGGVYGAFCCCCVGASPPCDDSFVFVVLVLVEWWLTNMTLHVTTTTTIATVEANIRGGGEFGPAWHQAALKEKRHKCYEDFIAVAEHLIASGICSAKTLAARGGSNVRFITFYGHDIVWREPHSSIHVFASIFAGGFAHGKHVHHATRPLWGHSLCGPATVRFPVRKVHHHSPWLDCFHSQEEADNSSCFSLFSQGHEALPQTVGRCELDGRVW